jgi:hypothetical protein
MADDKNVHLCDENLALLIQRTTPQRVNIKSDLSTYLVPFWTGDPSCNMHSRPCLYNGLETRRHALLDGLPMKKSCSSFESGTYNFTRFAPFLLVEKCLEERRINYFVFVSERR